MAEMVGFPIRFAHRIASAKPKILRLRLRFLGRQVLTLWVLIHTVKKQTRLKRVGFIFGGDGGIRTHVPG